MVALIISFGIEISTGSEIIEDFHDGVEISFGTPVGGLNFLLDMHPNPK